ncbi:nitroreductase/quinone reductase family protein [Leucobacter sp. gxy201]|uniref:nitroreductase/quinone reductase family protein n=1 Tax=Leucobacter sp. gxy201 TaxID=2957200 RepID=UPI003DA12C44
MTNKFSEFNDGIIAEFRANDGNVGGFGDSLLLVHHTGAKSGVERITPSMSIRDTDNTWLIAASKGGAPQNPAWYHNLLAHPDTTVEAAGRGEFAVCAEELVGEERDRAWEGFKALSPGFAQYERMTDRTIPVMRLTRRVDA